MFRFKTVQSIGTLLLAAAISVLAGCKTPGQTPIVPQPGSTVPPGAANISSPPAVAPPSQDNATPPAINPPTGNFTLPPGPVQGLYDIWIGGNEFRPSILTVPVGTTITWTNKDSEFHTVTSSTGLFDAGLSYSQNYSYTFTTAGTYDYHCSPHPNMTATILVK